MASRSLSRAASLAAASLLGALIIGGCADEEQAVQTVTVERQVTVAEQPPTKRRKRPKVQSLARKTAPTAEAFVKCDTNIQAKADTTTCPFAQNLFWAYWTSARSSSPVQVWSPAAQASFAATCEPRGAQVVCTTSDDGIVRFSQAAVDVYSQTQADSYASSHDLGPDPYEDFPGTAVPPEDAQPNGGGDDCQGYDPCIAAGTDVDCEGGSGNGPRYVDGPVYVDGNDPYGLDSNYDGVGCEY
jgi:hypothetical protein